MAVTINSNGTITGIAAGGLPDGVVDTDTLAADAVTAAKVADDVINSEHLVDGGVDNAHLATGIASSKLTGALPAISGASLTGISGGKVLQHQIFYATVQQEFNNSMTTTTNLIDVNFTPTASSSKVLIQVSMFAYHGDTSDGYWFGGIYRGATQIYVPFNAVSGYNSGSGNWFYMRQHWGGQYLDSPNTTSQINYTIKPYYGVSYTSSHFWVERLTMSCIEVAPN